MIRSVKRLMVVSASVIGLTALILKSETAILAAYDGVILCIRSLIPALLPFLVFSTLLTGTLYGSTQPFLRPVGRLCGMPAGSEVLLLIGLLGGYPSGARCIHQAYQNGQLSRQQAQRLLGFCNNAGPAFIFGIIGGMFQSMAVLWVLWAIHITTAVTVGAALPGKAEAAGKVFVPARPLKVTDAITDAVRALGGICAWVILFRVLLSFLDSLVLKLLPIPLLVLVHGMLELTNGSMALNYIAEPGLRFVISAVILSFGGACVGMQTASMTEKTGTGMYFPGKALQALLSGILGAACVPYLFGEPVIPVPSAILVGSYGLITWLAHNSFEKNKITVAFPKKTMYNGSSKRFGRTRHAVSEENA